MLNAALAALRDLLGPNAVLTGDVIPARALRDASILPASVPLAVLRPADTAQLAAAMAICHRHALPITVQGGMTGLSGGAIPQAGGLALSLERLRGPITIDPAAATLTAAAGTTLQEVQEAAAAAGFTYPVDLNARASCSIGGTLATNAGGNRVLRHGMSRQSVAGLEVVLADGRILSDLDGLAKDNAGFELRQLFIGSEGQLGIITRVMLRLQPTARSEAVALLGFDDFPALLVALASARAHLGADLSAFEAMWPDYWERVTAPAPLGLGRRSPFAGRHGLYALIETRSQDPGQAVLLNWLETALEAGLIQDAVLAQSGSAAADFWALREAAADLTPLLGKCFGYDLGLRLGDMGGCVEACRTALANQCPEVEMLAFGHAGDGNLHLMLAHRPGFDSERIERCDAAVYGVVASFSGTITAEHGIGALKRDWLPLVRNPTAISLMQSLKSALDPLGILNPGKVLGGELPKGAHGRKPFA